MRILFKGTVHPSAIAKSIKTALAVRDVHLGLRRCEEILARMCGYANWHELRQVSLAARAEHSPKDEIAGEEIAAERRRQFVGVLSGYGGVPAGIAGEVVDEVRPTGARRTSSLDPAIPAIPPETVDLDEKKLRKMTRRVYFVDGTRIYVTPEKEAVSLMLHGHRAKEHAGRRMLAFWVGGQATTKNRAKDLAWGRMIVRFGPLGQLQFDRDDAGLMHKAMDEEAGREVGHGDLKARLAALLRGEDDDMKPIVRKIDPASRRFRDMLGFDAPTAAQVSLGFADFLGETQLPPLPTVATGYEPSPEFVRGQALYEKALSDKRKRAGVFRRDMNYLLTEDGPVAADDGRLRSVLRRKPIPAFAGKRIPVVETLGGRPYEHLFLGRYLTFDADGRYVDDRASVTVGTMFGDDLSETHVSWRRHNTWKPEPETTEPMFLDILARMNLPGGRRLPTLGRHLGGLGSRRKPDPEGVRARAYVWTEEGPKRLTAATFHRDRPDAYPALAGARHRYLSVTYFVDEDDGPTVLPHGGFLTFRADGTVDRNAMMRDRQRWEPTKADLALVEADLRPTGHPDRRPIPLAPRGAAPTPATERTN